MASKIFHKSVSDRPMRHYRFPDPQRALVARSEREARHAARDGKRDDWTRLYRLVPALKDMPSTTKGN